MNDGYGVGGPAPPPPPMKAASTTEVDGEPSPSYLPTGFLASKEELLRRRSRSSLLVEVVLGDVSRVSIPRRPSERARTPEASRPWSHSPIFATILTRVRCLISKCWAEGREVLIVSALCATVM